MEKIRLQSIIDISSSIIDEQFQILKERDSQYGASYNKVGAILQILFPDGIEIQTKEQHQQFDLLKQVIGKLARLSHKFPTEIHRDSLIDAGNYINLLLAVIEQQKQAHRFIESIINPEKSNNETF